MNPAPPNRVGPYVILQRLGAGGMGEVYLGQDTRLDRKVALKCLIATGPEGDQRSRIIHEARAAAQINHGNVATIHDVIDEGSRAYIVMEYVEGESLAARLRRGRVPLREALAITRQLLSALTAAHAVGVIHRDLKPGNIQITRDGVVKVLDFGIAHSSVALAASPSDDTRSRHGDTAPKGLGGGTPAYMSPEQMVGESADCRADLYSLGVVLFELATGRRPYEYVDLFELLQMPDSLAPRATDVDSGVPAALADLLATALKCDPAERFQSATEFDDAIRSVQAQLDAARRPTRREWLALVGAGAAATAGIVLWTRLGGRASFGPGTNPSIAVLPFVNLSGDPTQEYFVDGMTDGLTNALGRIRALRVKARMAVMAFKGTRKSIAEVARELNVDFIVEGSALLRKNGVEIVRIAVNLVDPRTQTQLWSTALDRDLPSVLAIHSELARAIAARIDVSLTRDEDRRLASDAQPVDPETYKLYLLGRQEWMGRTVPQLQNASKYFAQAAARSPNYAPAYAGLADTYVLLTGDFAVLPRAEGAAQAIAHASRALALDPALGEAYTSLAFANFFLQWDFAAAGDQFKKALELSPNYATAHHWYGNYLSDMGREDEALAEIRKAVDLDPRSPIISRDVAWPLFFTRRYDEAIAQLDVTLAAFPGYLPAERLRARALAQRGDHADAIRQFEDLKRRGDNARARCELAWAYAIGGRHKDALAELQSAHSFTTGIYPYDVALAYAALNRTDNALAAIERAFEERDPTMVNLRHDPRFDSLRDHPRYRRVLAQMRFPQP